MNSNINDDEINQGIVIPSQTMQENLKSSAIDLLRRAVLLSDASWTLSLKYTYEIINKDKSKAPMRLKVGEMAGEIIDLVVDDLLEAGINRYLQSIGYNQDEIKTILAGKQNKMEEQVSSRTIIPRTKECQV